MGSHWIWFLYSYNGREKCNYIKKKLEKKEDDDERRKKKIPL